MENSADHCYLILQKFPNSGWGPAAIAVPPLFPAGPALYTGSNPATIQALKEMAATLHELTKLPTRFVRFGERFDILVFGGEDAADQATA